MQKELGLANGQEEPRLLGSSPWPHRKCLRYFRWSQVTLLTFADKTVGF